jgi:COPII coat assembly protein SEC16
MDSTVYASWNPALRPNTDADLIQSSHSPSLPPSLSSESIVREPEVLGDHSQPSQSVVPIHQENSDDQEIEAAWSADLDEDISRNLDFVGDGADNGHDFNLSYDSQRSEKNNLHFEAPNDAPAGDSLDWGAVESDPFDLGGFEAEQPQATAEVIQDPPVESGIDWMAADGDNFDIGENNFAHSTTAPEPATIDSSRDELNWEASAGDLEDPFEFSGTSVTVAEVENTLPVQDTSIPAGTSGPADNAEGNVASLWDEVLGDDDFLVDPPRSGDSAVEFPDFGNDEDGFLDDISQPNQADQNKILAEFPNESATTQASTSNRYAPAGFVPKAEPKQTASNFLPSGPQFTDFTHPNLQNTARAVSAAQPPIGYQSAPPVRPDLAPSAQSFADKSKGGYASPYDLPDDFSKPRKRPYQPGASNWNVPSIPPPRSTSLQSAPTSGIPRPGPPTSSYATKPITPPSSSHSANIPLGGSIPQQGGPTSVPVRPSSQGGFFEDLPIAPRQRSTPSGRYTPQSQATLPPQTLPPQTLPQQTLPPMMNQVQAAVPPISTSQPPATLPNPAAELPQFQAPARLDLYADDVHGSARAATVPAPVSMRYSPAPGSLPAVRQSSGPPLASSTRYSPAPTNKPLPAINQSRYATEPPQSRSQFTPRTSSPLTSQPLSQDSREEAQGMPPPVPPKQDHPSFNRISSLSAHPHLATVSENEATIVPSNAAMAAAVAFGGGAREMTPPPPRSARSSLSSSPRKRGSYVPAASTNDQTVVPPRRSQTSSPGSAALARAAAGTLNRPASAQEIVSPILSQPNIGFAPVAPRVPEKDVIPPQDERAADPLQRWRGTPIFVWGGSGTTITAFPTYTPRYMPGRPQPLMIASGGDFKVRNIRTIIPAPEKLAKFPGPLKKGKKKELTAWMKSSIEQLESSIKNLILNAGLNGIALIRAQERVILWKVLALLVEHDGILEGIPAVDDAVKKLLAVDNIESSPTSNLDTTGILPDAPSPKELGNLRSHLYKGEREEAVWHAVDQRLWGPALLIASTLSQDKWKQVVQEFVRKEVKDKALAALFQVFAGNWDESIDELVSVSARAGFQMVSTTAPSAHHDALAGLEKWRETVLLILSNRSPGDAQSLLAIGRVLATYGRFEAAHICFIFSKTNAFFGGSDDPRSTFSLVGGDPNLLGLDFDGDLESILLSEIYEYSLSISPTPVSPIPHLQAYKLYHAEVLAECNLLSEAQAYCDSINSSIHSKTKASPYYNVVLMQSVDNLIKRLSEAPADPSSGWKPSMDKVSSSLWGKFNQFIAGEDSETPQPSSGPGSDHGQFQRLTSDTPPMSATASNADLYSAYQSGAPNPTPSRYAPSNQYTPRRTTEPAKAKYEPVHGAPYQPRTSAESTRSSYEGRNSLEAITSSLSPKRVSSFPALGSVAQQHTNGHPNGLGVPPQATPDFRSNSTSPYNLTPSSAGQNGSPELSRTQQSAASYAPSFGYAPSYPSQTIEHEIPSQPTFTPMFQDSPAQTQDLGSSYELPASSYEPSTSTYEPTTSQYGQSSYQPYEPEPQTNAEYEQPAEEEKEEEPKPKKKSFMDDDDDDDLMTRVAQLKGSSKAKNDKATDDAFRKAAEADGKEFLPYSAFPH